MSLSVTDADIATAVAALPPVSTVMQRILSVLRDPHAQLEDIARLVRTETALASQVLRMANSAFFALPSPVGSVDEAIQRLGIAEVNRLVMMLGSRQLFLRPLRAYGMSADGLWQHTLGVAVCAETLTSYAEGEHPGAHLAGVLHPVGMVALESVAATRRIRARRAEESIPNWEAKVFQTDNATVAARVLRQWKFPPELADVVAGRYDPRAVPDSARRGASLLHVASLLAEKIHCGLDGERGCFAFSPDRLAAAGVPWDAMSEAEVEAAQNLERTRALLQICG